MTATPPEFGPDPDQEHEELPAAARPTGVARLTDPGFIFEPDSDAAA